MVGNPKCPKVFRTFWIDNKYFYIKKGISIMSMTMTQKILAAHAGLDKVEAGQLILVNLDRVLGNDITSPVAIKEFNKIGVDSVYDKEKVSVFWKNPS